MLAATCKPFIFFSLVFTGLLLLLHNESAAQGRWKDGYVVKKNGDTLTGKIVYHEKTRTPTVVIFKKEKGIAKQKFSPSDLRTFSVHMPTQQLYFKAFTAGIEVSDPDLSRLSGSAAPDLEEHNFFARLLVQGEKSLYAYKDTIVSKKHFMVETQDGKLTDLVCKRYYADNSRTLVATNEEYKQQLKQMYSDCSFVDTKKLDETPFTTSAFMKIAKDYNKCAAKSTQRYVYKEERNKPIFGVDLGMCRTSMKFVGSYVSGISFDPSYAVNAGVFLNLVLPRSERKWMIYNELFFTRYGFTSNVYNYGAGTAQTDVSAGYIKLANALRYQYPWHKLKPFLQLGFANGYAMHVSGQTKFSIQSYTNDDPVKNFRKYEQSVLGSIGVSYLKYELEIRSERGNGFSSANITVPVRYTAFLLKYCFH